MVQTSSPCRAGALIPQRQRRLPVWTCSKRPPLSKNDWKKAKEMTFAEDRRRNALLFLAAGEPGSALVQWLYLPEDELVAADGLTDKLVSELERQRNLQSEVTLIAAPVAVSVGLERLWSVDAQDFYAGSGDDDDDAYGAAISSAWSNPATREAQSTRQRLAFCARRAGGPVRSVSCLQCISSTHH